MEPRVLEGTLAEIQQELNGVSYPPDMRLRITIEAAGPQTRTKRTRNGITLVPVKKRDPEPMETVVNSAGPFRPTEFCNGVPLLPRRETSEPLSTEFVKRLLDEEDEEWLRAYRITGR